MVVLVSIILVNTSSYLCQVLKLIINQYQYQKNVPCQYVAHHYQQQQWNNATELTFL